MTQITSESKLGCFHLGFPTRSQLHRRIDHLPHAGPFARIKVRYGSPSIYYTLQKQGRGQAWKDKKQLAYHIIIAITAY